MAKSPEAKAAKEAAKAAKSAEKAEATQLKTAQKAELTALKNAGASKADIKAEKAANKIELKDAKKILGAAGIQTLKAPGTKTIFSSASTYNDKPYAEGVGSLLQKAASNYDYGIAPASKSGDTRIGTNLSQLVNYELGKGTEKLRGLVDRAKDLHGKNLTADELADMGIKVKEVKKQPGLYKYSTGSDNDRVVTYFKQNDDGTFSSLNTTRSVTPEASGIKGFMQSDLGKIAAIAAAVWGGPALGSYLAGAGTALGGAAGLSAAAQAGIGGALVGGTTAGLGGGDIKDILKGAVIGGTGAYGGQALKELAAGYGIGSLPTTGTPAPITNAGILPSLGEGAFDLGGLSGAELTNAGILPSLGDGAFDLSGFTGTPLAPSGIRATDLITAPPTSPLSPTTANLLKSTDLTGVGKDLGSFGKLGSAMPFNPADISLETTIPGITPQVGTAGFGTALRPAAELAADLAAAGFAPGTAANIAGLTPAGTGPTALLGGATALGVGAAGATLLDKAVEKAEEYFKGKAKDAIGGKDSKETNWPAILAALLGAGIGVSGRETGAMPTGYQGGIPTLTATRGEAGDPLAGGRRAGGAGIPILTGGVTYAAEGGLMGLKSGRYLDGHTDGMADEIKTDIDGKQPARLSHGEFVIPADVVSHLGNGNSDAGAKVLYQMMAKVRRARTGNPKQGKQINPGKFVPV